MAMSATVPVVPRLRLTVLGRFSLTCDDVAVPVSSAGQRLLALLALRGRPVRRSRVTGYLWSDGDDVRAMASLRSALHRLPRPTGALVRNDDDAIALRSDVEVDLRAGHELATRLEAGAPSDDQDVPAALLDDVLPDWYDEWIVLERECYRQMRLHALEALCRSLVRSGRPAAALRAGLAAVDAEPLRESAHRVVIEAHLAEGNVGEALRQYRTCFDHLDRGLGLRPSQELQDLVFRDRSPRAGR